MRTDCSHIAVFRLQSSNPAYKLLISVWSRITSCATCGTVPREVSGTWCGVARVFRPGMANLPTRGARTGAVEARTLKVIAGDADVAWSMAFVVIESPCCGRPGSCSYRPGEIGFPDKHHYPPLDTFAGLFCIYSAGTEDLNLQFLNTLPLIT